MRTNHDRIQKLDVTLVNGQIVHLEGATFRDFHDHSEA